MLGPTHPSLVNLVPRSFKSNPKTSTGATGPFRACVSLSSENDAQASCSTTGSWEDSDIAVGFRIQWTPELDDSLMRIVDALSQVLSGLQSKRLVQWMELHPDLPVSVNTLNSRVSKHKKKWKEALE